MTQFSNFVKKNIRAGKTLYVVHAFPERKEASIQVLRVFSRPILTPLGAGLTPKFHVLTERNTLDSRFLGDMHLHGPNQYNFHRAFTSKKKAQAYVELVRQGTDVRSFFGYSQSVVDHYLRTRTPARLASLVSFEEFPDLDTVDPCDFLEA